jgi:predicted O-linked N-acetylglucosamine transferase (SPINDLY family)
VLTCPGKSFASRVAESLLVAADLTEFISKSLNDYEEKAIYYGLNKKILNNIREDFKKNCFTGIRSTIPCRRRKLYLSFLVDSDMTFISRD